MKKKSKADRQFEEDQKLFRKLLIKEPMILMRCLVRRTLTREALALEEQLTHLGLNYHEREAVYQALNLRREVLEAELHQPGAYERLMAEASVMGLLSPVSQSESQGKEATPQ